MRIIVLVLQAGTIQKEFSLVPCVLNDDRCSRNGFCTHPHDNMEIITIPLEGDLAHKDSMGNTEIIRNGDVQVMSAGTGVKHSEFNQDQRTKLLQIWVFQTKNVEPLPTNYTRSRRTK
jgi:redox-sensitive bicupin YhaK (pirin superfamily)